MKKKHLIFRLFLLVAITFTGGCFSSQQTMKLNSIELTNQLKAGMPYTEVETLLGKPKTTINAGDQFISRWNLQQMWRGYIPYDLVFNSSDRKLLSWSENSKAFEQQQTQLQVVADEAKKMEAAQAAKNSGGGAAANFENNVELMAHFQGSYYSFTSSAVGGSSERKVSFCPNGRYISASESSYSGGAGTSGAWGNASQGGGGGTWKITGTKASGTIAITSNGKTSTYKYSSCGNGCLYLGSTKYAYAGAAECR
jgi:hypothetical protein